MELKKAFTHKIAITLQLATFVFAPSIYAIPMTGDTVKLSTYGTYRDANNGGGEFLLTGVKDKNDAILTYEYITFCLEQDEFFTPGTEYYIDSVADFANLGGPDKADSGADDKDYISNATKWLMNSYINDFYTLNGIFGFSTRNDFAGSVQEAIWYFEDEYTAGESVPSDSQDIINYVIVNWSSIGSGGWNDYDATYLTNVQVANIMKGETYKQSQLFATAPVPEPATMVLFGTGLVGLAGFSRHRKKSRK